MRSVNPPAEPQEAPDDEAPPQPPVIPGQPQEWTAEQHLFYERRKGETPANRRRRVRNKYWLLVTLFNNPELKQDRRHELPHEVARLDLFRSCWKDAHQEDEHSVTHSLTRRDCRSTLDTNARTEGQLLRRSGLIVSLRGSGLIVSL